MGQRGATGAGPQPQNEPWEAGGGRSPQGLRGAQGHPTDVCPAAVRPHPHVPGRGVPASNVNASPGFLRIHQSLSSSGVNSTAGAVQEGVAPLQPLARDVWGHPGDEEQQHPLVLPCHVAPPGTEQSLGGGYSWCHPPVPPPQPSPHPSELLDSPRELQAKGTGAAGGWLQVLTPSYCPLRCPAPRAAPSSFPAPCIGPNSIPAALQELGRGQGRAARGW